MGAARRKTTISMARQPKSRTVKTARRADWRDAVVSKAPRAIRNSAWSSPMVNVAKRRPVGQMCLTSVQCKIGSALALQLFSDCRVSSNCLKAGQMLSLQVVAALQLQCNI